MHCDTHREIIARLNVLQRNHRAAERITQKSSHARFGCRLNKTIDWSLSPMVSCEFLVVTRNVESVACSRKP
jgi:hypothetical protein